MFSLTPVLTKGYALSKKKFGERFECTLTQHGWESILGFIILVYTVSSHLIVESCLAYYIRKLWVTKW